MTDLTKSNYIGEIKKRETFRLRLMNKMHFENQYGDLTYYFFESDHGDSVVWKASAYLTGMYSKTEVCPEDGPYTFEERYHSEIGDVIELKGTVKEHSIYASKSGDIKTTYIARVKPLSFERNGESHALS